MSLAKRGGDLNMKEKQELQVTDVFTKSRIFTYLWIVFCPPYGLYRVLSPSSEFRRPEKWVWTMIVICTLVTFVKLIITG